MSQLNLTHKQCALIIIDIQNDYFPDGQFPLWNTESTLNNIESAIQKAHTHKMPIVLIQHVADAAKGEAPFFNEGTTGVKLHARILAAAPNAPVIRKSYADSFLKTNLESTLAELGVTSLLICGMMTQNCVTHTAISKAADKYSVFILADCCTSTDVMIHKIALNGISPRVPLLTIETALT